MMFFQRCGAIASLSNMFVLQNNDSDDLTATRPAVINAQNLNQSDFGSVLFR